MEMRRLHQEDRGRLRDSLGLERLARHGLQAQPQGLRRRRRVAPPQARGGLPLRLPRRHLHEAQLGRRLRERGRARGHRECMLPLDYNLGGGLIGYLLLDGGI